MTGTVILDPLLPLTLLYALALVAALGLALNRIRIAAILAAG